MKLEFLGIFVLEGNRSLDITIQVQIFPDNLLLFAIFLQFCPLFSASLPDE